jgi:hypothetical protein|tara:strand:+ start:155 stop:436 length:282 start_codon:yes stop_codon:yes gene_type:complete
MEGYASVHRAVVETLGNISSGKKIFTITLEKLVDNYLTSRQHEVSFTDACADVFVANKFAGTTTNWRQLHLRIARRDADRTPMLFLGIPKFSV